jgi:2-hydroxychromene-2-carboxylate isomerase
LGGLHKIANITAPAFNYLKMKNMKNDCELVSKKNNIKFKWNKKFPINSLDLMRGYLSINDQIKKKYFEVCFDSYWKDDLDISENENMIKILEICKIDQKKFLDDIKDQKIKDELKYLTDIAFKNDIFGAPTFVVNKKIFWGQDRLEYAIDEVLI